MAKAANAPGAAKAPGNTGTIRAHGDGWPSPASCAEIPRDCPRVGNQENAGMGVEEAGSAGIYLNDLQK